MVRCNPLSLLFPVTPSNRWHAAATDTLAQDCATLCRWHWQHTAIVPVAVPIARNGRICSERK
jgi:hypothetical protein